MPVLPIGTWREGWLVALELLVAHPAALHWQDPVEEMDVAPDPRCSSRLSAHRCFSQEVFLDSLLSILIMHLCQNRSSVNLVSFASLKSHVSLSGLDLMGLTL